MNKIQKFTITTSFVLALALILGCSSEDEGGEEVGGESSSSIGSNIPSNGNSSSSGFGNSDSNYEKVTIGLQVWMKKNLNINIPGSKCYGEGGEIREYYTGDMLTLSNNEIQSYCDKYGRLYTWETAMDACPNGWHLPTNTEWDALYKLVDSDYETDYNDDVGFSKTAGKYLKATSGWMFEDSNGTDDYGFAALPGGYGNSDGDFFYGDKIGYWWSASEKSANIAYVWSTDDNYPEWAHWVIEDKSNLFSIRCVKD